MSLKELQKLFSVAAGMPAGDCSFPEPGDIIKIEDPGNLRVHLLKPITVEADNIRFKKTLDQMVIRGKISEEERDRILKSI